MRGDKSGSLIIKPAVKDARGRTLVPEKIYVRRRYRDPVTKKLREKKRLVQNRTAAREKQHDLLDEIKIDKVKLVQGPPPAQKTFADLLVYFRKHYAKPAKYRGGVKVEGYRSIGTVNANLKTLEAHFGPRALTSITYEQLRTFKEERLKTDIVFNRRKVRTGRGSNRVTRIETITTRRERAAASVHRELQLLRRLLNLALKKKWITESPFLLGDTLIHTAAEPSRMRILTQAEERKLLACCFGPREHLGPAIVFALETAMRENEQFAMTVADVDLAAGVAIVKRMSDNKKRVFDRLVPISEQLRPVLEKLIADSGVSAETINSAKPLFKHHELKRSFHTACRLAGIENMRWHDLRHTAITWMVAATGDPAMVMKISGHTQWRTFLRYVNVNAELARGVAAKMNARRADSLPLTLCPSPNATGSNDDGNDSRPA